MERKDKMDKHEGGLHSRFEELKVKAAHAKVEVREELEEKMKDIHHLGHSLRHRANNLKRKGSGAWESMKEGFDHASDEVKKAFDEVRGKMKH